MTIHTSQSRFIIKLKIHTEANHFKISPLKVLLRKKKPSILYKNYTMKQNNHDFSTYTVLKKN